MNQTRQCIFIAKYFDDRSYSGIEEIEDSKIEQNLSQIYGCQFLSWYLELTWLGNVRKRSDEFLKTGEDTRSTTHMPPREVRLQDDVLCENHIFSQQLS